MLSFYGFMKDVVLFSFDEFMKDVIFIWILMGGQQKKIEIFVLGFDRMAKERLKIIEF